MMWVIKEEADSWKVHIISKMFLEKILFHFFRIHKTLQTIQKWFIFMIIPPMSSCTNIIQQLLKDSGIDCFDKTQQWPGHSPDVNKAEHLGVILTDLVEHFNAARTQLQPIFTQGFLFQQTKTILQKLQYDTHTVYFE